MLINKYQNAETRRILAIMPNRNQVAIDPINLFKWHYGANVFSKKEKTPKTLILKGLKRFSFGSDLFYLDLDTSQEEKQ